MWVRLKRWLERRSKQSGLQVIGRGFVRARVDVDKLIPMLKAPKDVIVWVSSARWVAALCKACAETIEPTPKDGLLWMVCPRCGRMTFLPLANLPRDVEFAQESENGIFEYELFAVRELPPGFSPPGPAGS
jgi:hypothetical protein